MNILFAVHLYPPKHNCGGEYFIHNLSKYLIWKGHTVRVILYQAHQHKITTPYEFDKVMVYPSSVTGIKESLFLWATHVLTHLEYSKDTINMAKLYQRPVFFISHNDYDYLCIRNGIIPVNVIYNSSWMAEKLNYPQRSIVFHPPLDKSKILHGNFPINNEWITLVNCNERKGGSIFKEIVKRMPEKKFLCVMGSYDEQIIPQKPNVMCARNSDDMLQFYKLTRIILMPSAYESYGMVATEAAANGIPVICTPTDGLRENLGDAGIYVDSPNTKSWMVNHEKPAMDYLDSSDIDLWVKEIEALDDEKNYFSASNKCRQRALELDPLIELQAVEKFIQDAD